MFGYIFNNRNFCIINLVSLPIEIMMKNSRHINTKGVMQIHETLITLNSNCLMEGQLNLSLGNPNLSFLRPNLSFLQPNLSFLQPNIGFFLPNIGFKFHLILLKLNIKLIK